jgi:hypothetical protein
MGKYCNKMEKEKTLKLCHRMENVFLFVGTELDVHTWIHEPHQSMQSQALKQLIWGRKEERDLESVRKQVRKIINQSILLLHRPSGGAFLGLVSPGCGNLLVWEQMS